MEFGMFHEFQALPGETAAQSFANSLAQVDAAEEWGLDAMWLAELHFAPERSVLSSPMMIAATIAQRTERMKIGTAVQVLPLCHPLRLAEEVATVDQLSKGRLIFGVGRSGFAHTYKTYGVDYGESRERFAETLHILKRAFTEERFSHQGKYFSYENVRLAPEFAGVTHLVYASLYERPGLVAGWQEDEQIRTNDLMLRNLLGLLERASPALRHVALLQGTKAYGVHVRPLAVPARENRSEMHEQPNFYWNQERYLR